MSEKLSLSLFHSEWYLQDRRYKTSVNIFMEYSKKSIEFTALGVFTVNLENFTAICNSAYSLYAVFQEA